ncbi:transposase [Streptococcus pneumoniae]|nr:transposase [Streptococcus pneumoniae]
MTSSKVRKALFLNPRLRISFHTCSMGKQVHPLFQTVFKTFLKDKEKIVNALQLHYSNAKLEATNNLIKLIKRNAFGFRNFENFKKRIFIALNIKKERTKFVLSQA